MYNREYNLIKHKCEICGGSFDNKHRLCHFRTKKHIDEQNKLEAVET